ncbi:MAG: CPA2 family monovalent cation:H+ antiporter-2 [Alphaproteobacteria bacterium]|jgi:CPA2 family monovalent cation:H+ antiporter-2
MTDTHFLSQALIFLAGAVATATLFKRINVSPVIGYLVAGAFIGPYGTGIIADTTSVRGLAELGVVFLMFAIGLELTLKRLVTMRGQLFGLGTAQFVASGLALGGAAYAFGLDVRAAIIIGAALALSSTAIVLQLLGERGEIVARAGRVALAILLFQDLAVVPLIVLVPQLGAAGSGIIAALGLAFAKAVLVLVVIMVVGRLILRPLFRVIAARRTPELLVGLALLVILGAGFATEMAGLSLALGAFLAGLLVAETEFRHQVEADMAPFRGILLSLFFMTVGMSVDFTLLASAGPLIGLVVAGILVIKALTITGVGLLFRLPLGLALRQGFLLAESGEFAFILFAMAGTAGLIDPDTGRILVLAVALTMVLTPLLAMLGRKAEQWLEVESGGLDKLAKETEDLQGHVLMLGFGRVGEVLARLFCARTLPFIALDLDPARVSHGRSLGLPVYYGDASSRLVLRAAHAERAQLAVITMNDAHAAVRAVTVLRNRFPDMPIYVRASDQDHCDELTRLGATGIVPEIMEVSLNLGSQTLTAMGLAEADVARLLAAERARAAAPKGALGDETPKG